MRNKRTAVFLFGIFLLVCIGAQPGYCYSISTTGNGSWIKWFSNSVSFHVNDSGAPAGFTAASRSAMGTWSGAGARFAFQYAGSTTSRYDAGQDGVNSLSFGPHEGSVLGLNRIFFYEHTGQLVESDIILNSNVVWGGASGHDVESVILHELGHALSLADLYDARYEDRVMYGYGFAGDVKRELHQGDINGIRALYGESVADSTYTISLGTSPVNGGSVSGAGTYAVGATVTVRAVANAGYAFLYWSEAGVVQSTHAAYAFTVAAHRDLVAHFTVSDQQMFAVDVSAFPVQGGEVAGGGTYSLGASVTVRATAYPGYRFVNWTEGTTGISTNSAYTFTVSGNRALVAHFSPVPAGCPPEAPVDCGNGYCCPEAYPRCGYGADTGMCFRGACLASYLLGDDDPRLDVLRQFRDQKLSASPDGRAMVALYYEKSSDIINLCKRYPVLQRSFADMLERMLPAVAAMLHDGT